MRKITLTFFLFLFEIGFSQSAPITFETGGQGASWTFTNFDNGPSPTVGFEKVVNPFKTGINTSETVGKYTALSGADLGGKGAGCQSKHGVDLGTFKLSYSNCTIKIMVYKTVISDVGIKFAEADGGSNGELLVKNTKINEWEELIFDFTSRIGATKSGAIDQLILFMDLTDNRPAASVSYFDDITFSKSLVPPPVVACDAVLTDALEGSFAVGYKTKFETVGTNVNITFELLDQKDGLVAFLHRESPFEETQMENNPAGTRIFTKTITGQTKGDIISYACKFAYAGGLSKTKYIKYEVGSFCDGIAPTAPTVAAPTPTATAPNVISLFSGGAYTDLAGTNWNPGWGQSTVYEEVQIAGNATKKYSNFNYQGVVLQSPVDVSSMAKLHLDVWSPDCTALKVFLIPTTGAEKSITVNPTLSGWNSFDINLADYTGVDTKSIKELKFESVTAGTTVFIDNLYFIKDVNPSLTMNAPVTFETGDHGAAWIFVNFDNGPGTEGFEKVANPSATGINTSSTVGKFTATVDGSPWAGCKTNDIGRFTLDPQNSLVKIMVYKTVISDVALKFAVAGGGSLGEIKVKNTKVNQWEELSFEFYNQIGKLESTDIVTMNISLDYQGRAAQSVSYFDNITFSKTSVPSPVQVCDAILTEASQGSFTTGYKANFATVGTDVNITFELLDQRDGLVAGLWKESPFAELPMVNEPAGSKIYKAKLTDQKVGSLISYACKFAYAGGQSVTKYIKYEVGTACTGTPPVFTGPTIPMDFESGTFAFVDFDGGAASTVDNPNKSGINTSNKVAKMVKGAGAAWAGSKIKLTSPVNFSTDKKLKVKVWSPVAGKKLLLKFEGAGAAFEKEAATTVANTWEELTFDYTGVAGVNNLNDNMVFIFDLGTVGDGSANSTYYFDEITQPSSTPPVVTGPTIPMDFETGTFAFVDFDGGAASTVDNPNKSGINTSNKVAKMVKGAGAAWAGSKIKLTSPVNFSTDKKLKVKVWSPVAGKKLLLKFEGAGAAFEKEAATTVANTWEELTFDYTGVAGVNNLNDNMVFIFDLGTVGDGSANSTYYFDEITQPSSTPPVVTGPTIPMDFESGTFAFVDFDGGAASTVDNPNKSGINTSNKVAKMVKGAGQPWGGSKLTLATPVDFSTKKIFKVKVWSPVAGKKLLLKFESPNGNFERESVGVTTANTWEELTFDFTNVSTNNTASDMVFIFDLGTTGDGSANSTYYFDEITQSAGSAPVTGATLPLDFEAATYSFVDFDGGVATKVVNPQSNGINTSANVAKMVKGAGAMWAGSKIKMATPVDFTTNKLFKVKVWSPVAGKKLLLKFEGTAGNFEQESTGVTAANTWEELTFDFSKVATNNAADFMVFIFDFGTVGDGSANSTYYFDDVKQASIPVTPPTNYLVSFETGSVIGTWNSFENPGQTGFEFANNPSKTGINTSDKVGKFTAVPTGQRWAGCETASGTIGTWELDATSTTVTMMVYKSVISPVAIKMATKYNGTTFEIKKNNTKINEWELMTFDISKFITSGDATMINKFVVFPDFREETDPVRNSDVVLYFDDIKFSAKKLFDPNYVAPPVENPTVAATTPPVRNAADVKSIFSDAYAVYKAGNWCQCWGQSTIVEDVVIVAGDNARLLKDFTYQGITLPDGEVFNVSDMNKVHIDIWFNDAKSVSLALVQQTSGGSKEAALKFTPTKTGWNSFDIDLNSTTLPGIDLAKVFQMKLTTETKGANVFLDNFYFWKDAATVLAQMDLPVTFDDATVDYSLLGFGGTEGSTIVTDPTLATNKVAKVLKPALSETWAGITISGASGLGFKNKIPFSTSVTTMSVRIWSPDAGTIVRLKVEDHADKNRTVETESIVTTAKGWETVVFDFAKPVSGTAALNLGYTYDKATIFFGFGSTGTEKIYYFDDVAFGAAAPEVVEEPLTAAPTPPARNVADVKSVFSGAYADIAGTSWNENWGQSTVSEEVSIVGNATKKLSNLNYQGVVPTTGIDATGMTQLHLDIWTPDCTAFDVYLINPGPVEQKVTLTPTLSGWNSFDINLSDYTTIALNNVFQFKFVSPNQNSTVYLDNMYFYKEAGVEPIAGIPTNLNYGGNLRFEINKDVFSVTPTVSADPFPTFSISPDMPKGMSFDTVSGSIVGKPTKENAPVSFTVTATNSVGSQQLTFTIEIFNDDHDFDGINDDVDNCSEFYNPNQEDLNNDGVGDICIEEEQVKAAQGFSPNGDGKNDAWLIKNVENHPNTHVTVFNKTGAEVFSSRDYKNLWDGSYKNTGKIVAAGSYFYQVDLGGDGSVDLQGWIYIAN